MRTDRQDRLDQLRQAMVDEEDARVRADISEEARQYVPRNFLLIAICQTLSNLADHLVNPRTVLTWLLGFVEAPVALVGLLVPIRESGSLVPQLLIVSFVRRIPRRKIVWVAARLFQALAVFAVALVATRTRGALAGWLIILFLILYSLSRGFSSVASKDVVGKTIPKRSRGRLSGLGATLSGAAAALLGLYMGTRSDLSGSPAYYAALLGAATGLWIVAALIYATVRELANPPTVGTNALIDSLRRLSLLRTDRNFRRFVTARALFLCSALSGPYYVLVAQQQHGADLKSLGWFVLANGLAASLSASFWGLMADVSSRRVLLAASTWAALLGLAVFAISTFHLPLHDSAWTYPAAFFLLGIAHAGVRLGRKTYILDMAGGSRRTDYAAVANSVIGVVLLLTTLLAPLAEVITPAGIILVLSICGLFGVAIGATLEEVE